MNDIDKFLRDNKPVVKDDPTFLLETRRKMDSVKGIKAEVDRQRSNGRVALIVTLAIGLAIGVLATSIAFLYPVDVTAAGEGFFDSVRVFLDRWKQYLFFPVAALAVVLSLVLTRSRQIFMHKL